MTDLLVWLGIVFCITQSAMFSGMNLAVFSISRLRLEAGAAAGQRDAKLLLDMRQDANFLLTTILWGNVGINVLLTLLSDSVMTGVLAFLFSTVLITFAGEIIPQAYFSRHALRMGALLSPVLRLYQFILYPTAKPTALLLDRWLGAEGVQYFRERDMREVIKMHIEADETDLGYVEGVGALNFLAFDDLLADQEGEAIDPASIISVALSEKGTPIFPPTIDGLNDPFIKKIERSGKKWVILTNDSGSPQFVLDADGFLRYTMFRGTFPPYGAYCHRPIIITDKTTKLGRIIRQLSVREEKPGDDVIDKDIILVWTDSKRIITGADILGRLMRGIAKVEK